MPIFPYENEEERKRRRLNLPTEEGYPGPTPPALPEISTPRQPMMGAGNPGSITPPTFPNRRPSRFEEMNEAKDVYMQKRPSRLGGAVLGGLQAIGGGGSQDLGGAVGQGIGGLIGGLINPKAVRERQFNQRVRPQIEDRFRAEDAERAATRQAEQDALGVELERAKIGATNRQNIPAPPRPQAPIRSDRGLYDPAAGGIIPGTEPLPPAPRELSPRPVLNERGEYVDFNAETKAGRKVKAFQKPKAVGSGKAKQPPKVVSMTQIREYMKQTGKSRSDAIADAMRDGYRIAR